MKYEITPGRIIKEFAKLGFANIDEFLNENGDIDVKRAGRDARAALAGYTSENGEKGRKVTIKLSDKRAALVELAKLARMYPVERLEHSGVDGGPIASVNVNVSKIDIESLDHEQRQQLKQTLLMLRDGRNREA